MNKLSKERKKSKIDEQAVKKAVPRAVLRLLPVGALFLPLGTLTIKIITEKATQYNLVGLIQALFGQENQLLVNLIKTDMMAAPRAWLYVTAAGLILSILAMLAGFAFLFAEKVKPLAAGAAVYGAGALGGICAVIGFAQFGGALGPAIMNMAGASVNYGAYDLAAMLLLNLVVCLAQWRGAKERERLTALARKQKQKKNR
ncbi:MAG: hypothetical protein LBB75_03860 [Oscillospiraceae bacterium]|nr:hypothetical protein [Oscillospiraceae bacterium]